jgi:hypothetical protein
MIGAETVAGILEDVGLPPWTQGSQDGFSVASSDKEVLIEVRCEHYGLSVCEFTDARQRRQAALLEACRDALHGVGFPRAYIQDGHLVIERR